LPRRWTRETVVAWSETDPTMVDVAPADVVYDFLGRGLSRGVGGKLELTRKTIFLILAPGGTKQLKLEPPPTKPPRLEGKPCPVVLQLVGQGDVKQSAFRLDDSKELHLIAYNFGDRVARGTLTFQGAAGPAGEIAIAPGAREQRTVKSDGKGSVIVRLDLGDLGRAIVSGRVTTASQGEP